MRLTLGHAQYIANKIGIDLNKSGMVMMTSGLESVINVARQLIEENIKTEQAIEEKARVLLEENEDEIDFYRADEKQLFWMIKKKLSLEEGFILNYEERYSTLSHEILDELYEEDLINYDVSENQIKNIIYESIESYLNGISAIEDIVIDKIASYKKPLIPGTDEYEVIFQKLYEEELKKKGIL